MKYFGIKTPSESSYVWWLATTQHDSWMAFFTYPNSRGEMMPHRLPLAEAIKAYESIGYRCIELEVTEKELGLEHEECE